MDLPLPNEVLTDIFSHLQDSISTLKALCLVLRGFAHVARPFLYTSLPLPFLRIRYRDRPGSGLVLDPAAYARFKAVTSDEASLSLKRAVKVVRMSGGGERGDMTELVERLDWQPQNVLATLLQTCDNLHGLKLEDPSVYKVVKALGTLPSDSRLTLLSLASYISPSTFSTLVGSNSTLSSLFLRVGRTKGAALATLVKLPSLLPSLVNLTLFVPYSGNIFGTYMWYLSSDTFDRLTFPRLNQVDVRFICPPPRHSYREFWSASPGNSSPQMGMVGWLPRLCKEAGITLLVEGREVPEV